MQIPISVPAAVLKVYAPSQMTTSMPCEQGRTIFAEDFSIGEEAGPSCATLCLDVICEHLRQHPDQIATINEMDCKERNVLIECLPGDLPLSAVLESIPDDLYWMKYTLCRWPDVLADKDKTGKWRTYYLRRYITEYIEQQMPEYYDIEDIEKTCTLVADHIFELDIKQMIPSQPNRVSEDDPEAPLTYSDDHFPLDLPMKCLKRLESLRVRFGMKKLGEHFNWHLLKVSKEDCRRLGDGVLSVPGLRKLSLHRSFIGDDEIQPLILVLLEYPPLEELDISYCNLRDRGGLMLGKLLSVHPNLKTLRLPGNLIGDLGAQGIAYGIKQESSCPLDFLDLRLNPLGDEGVLHLFCGLVRVKKPRFLGIAGVSVHGFGGLRIAEAIALQKSLQQIDIAANTLGVDGGDWLVTSFNANIMLIEMDCRDTEITAEQLEMVQACLARNKDQGVPSLSDVRVISDQIIHRQFSFPVTDSEILLQDAKDAEWALRMSQFNDESSEEDLEVLVIKEYDGANHEEEEDGLVSVVDSSNSTRFG